MIWDLFKKLDSSSDDDGASGERWLIVGLGNPGQEYAETRHNVGFMVIEKLARDNHMSAKQENKFKALVATGRLGGTPVTLAQPLTYMNLSGESVIKLAKFYDVPPERILVVYDDAALPFGKLRVRGSGSAGGQNGIKSIIKHLGNCQDFPRIRVGIGAPEGQRQLRDHVLSKFNKDEQVILDDVLKTSCDAVEALLKQPVDQVMSKFNGLNLAPQKTEARLEEKTLD